MRYVIIGNSAAGVACVEEIRKNDKDGEIVVISEEKYHSYSRPLISYYLKGRTEEKNMYYRPLDFYEKMNVDALLGKKATKIDPKAKKVYCGKEAVPYDKLLIATGSVPFVPPIEGADKHGFYTFLSWDDAKELKKVLTKESRVVVIGGGLIGLKAAEGAHKIAESVTVVELADRVLSTILDNEAGGMIASALEENNIKCVLGDTAESFDGKSVKLRSGGVLPCDILIVAVGVRANAELAKGAGCAVSRGIETNEYQETTVPDIYAAGDCAESFDITDGKKKILALLPNAVKQGKVAGSRMSGGDKRYDGGYPMNAIDFFSNYITTCGVINPPEGEGYEVKRKAEGRKYRKMVFKDGRLVGYILINEPDLSGILTSMIADRVETDTLENDIFEDFGLMSYNSAVRYTKLHGGDEN